MSQLFTWTFFQQLKAWSLVTLFLLRCRPVGGPCSRKVLCRQPVNLGTWEPDSIGTMSSHGAKAVSEVKVPPPLQNQHNLYERLVSICIKYKIYNYPKLVLPISHIIQIVPTPPPRKGGCHFCSEATLQARMNVCLLWYPSSASWTGGASIGLEDNQWPADPWIRLSSHHGVLWWTGFCGWAFNGDKSINYMRDW